MKSTATEPGTATQGDCASPVVFSILFLWIVLIAFARAGLVLLLSVDPQPATYRFGIMISLGEAILIGLPLLLLANLWRNPNYRAIFQTWAYAALLILFLLPAQFVDPTAAQTQAILHTLLALIFTAVLALVSRNRRRKEEGHPQEHKTGPSYFLIPGLVAITAAALAAYPWLAWGAQGSFLDSLLQLAAALSLGLASATTLTQFLLRPFDLLPDTGWRGFLLKGFGAGGTLAILASATGFSFGGMQLILLLVLPAFAWAVVGIQQMGSPIRPVAGILLLTLIIGLVAAAPMILVDPDELALIIGFGAGEIVQWAFTAAGTAVVIGLAISLLSIFFALLRSRTSAGERQPARTNLAILGAAAVIAFVTGGLIYWFAGQPGFYGERMFVVLKSQADISAAASIGDYSERRNYVYDTLVENANSTQAGIRSVLERFNISYTPYYLENSLEVIGNPLLRAWLLTQPEVDRVLDSPVLRPLPETRPVSTGDESPPAETPWNLSLIGADRVWNELGVTGEGIVVGQSDSGVQGDHPELAGNYRGAGGQNDFNWYDPWYGTTTPTDVTGHGTHTLGTILGRNTGIAPGATWYACVNLSRNLGNPALYLDCMQFMLAPFPLGGDPFSQGDPARGAHVINNSWGCPDLEGCDPETLQIATRALRLAGIFVVASAGNSGPACSSVTDPLAIYSEAYTVGAIDRNGELGIFSSRGPVSVDGSGRVKPDIVAPGVEVLSAFPGSTYDSLLGTSMAGPHVAGTVALMWSANPSLIGDIDRTAQILNQTARPYSGQLPDCPQSEAVPSTAVGYGILDAFAAVQMAIQQSP